MPMPSERELMDLSKVVAVMQSNLDAHAKALDIAREEMNRRLEGMNKFREEMAADKLGFVPRQEWHMAHESLIARVEEKLNSLLIRSDSKSEDMQKQITRLDNYKWMVTGMAVAISSLVGMVIHFILPGK